MIKFSNLFESSNNVEIERKFLVKDDSFEKLGAPLRVVQGYISDTKKGVVRVRVYGDKGFITIKARSEGISRPEYEYEIPLEDSKELLELMCDKVIDKIRYEVFYKGFKWEVDKFSGDNSGLVIAEIELKHPEQKFRKPDWVGEEVTNIDKYYNSNLIQNPYKNW